MDQLKLDELKKVFANISWDTESGGYIVPKNDLLKFCKYVKETSDTSFDYLKCLTAVDYPEKLELIYELYSFRLNIGLHLKVPLTHNDLKIDSVVSVWGAADWFEREVYDMFGVEFSGHPNLKRILLSDGWKGFPLRKNYVDEKIAKKPI